MKNRSVPAFSLIEILVSVGIVAIISVLIIQTYVATIRNNTKAEIMKDLKQNGDYALQVMTRLIQNAANITSCGSHSVRVTDHQGNYTVFSAVSNSGVCRVASASATRTEYLTSSNITLNGSPCSDTFSVSCSNVSGLPAKANISFILKQINTDAANFESASMNFQTNVTIRNLTY